MNYDLWYVLVPVILFVISGATTGIILLVKGSAYMARSQVAQEQTRDTNQEISDKLTKYIEKSDGRQNAFDVRLSVVEAQRNGYGRH